MYEAELHENVRHEGDVDDHLLDGSHVGQQAELAHELEYLDLEAEQPGQKLAEDDLGVLLGRREDRLDVQQLRVLEVEEDDDEEADPGVRRR